MGKEKESVKRRKKFVSSEEIRLSHNKWQQRGSSAREKEGIQKGV
jgi:hypothetical protein